MSDDRDLARLHSWLFPNGGWSLLLPDVDLEHLVVVDTAPGRTVMVAGDLCERLTVVPAREADVTALEDAVARLDHLEIDLLPPVQRCPVGERIDASVSGVVVNLLPESGSDAGPGPAWRLALVDWLRRLREVASGNAFVWLAARNACSYRRLRHRGPRPLLGCGGRSAARLLADAGFAPGDPRALLTHHGRIFEVLSGDGYRSVTGRPSSVGERVRQILLGRWGSGLLAPAYGCLGFARTAVPSRLDTMMAAANHRVSSRRTRMLLQPDKALAFVEGDEPGSDGVLVVPLTQRARERRRNERRVLRRLAREVPDLDLVPEHRAHGSHRGISWELLENVQGISVDEPVDDLDELTAGAYRFLLRLHQATRRDVRVDEANYERFFGSVFRRARRRYPPAREFLDRLEIDVRDLVKGCRLPTVWTHGDFKIENVLLDARTREPSGVIDWELSKVRGLPMLDLLYLLTYNHMLRTGHRFDQTYVEVTMRDAWTPEEWKLLRGYQDAVPTPGGLAVALEAMLLVQALGHRFTYDLDYAPHRDAVLEMIACAAARAGGAASRLRQSTPKPRTGTEG